MPRIREVRLVHVRLPLNLDGLGIAPLRAQRIRQQAASLSLRAVIAARQRQRLAPATLSLMRVALREPQPPAFDPQQRIVRLDAQGAVQGRRGAVKVTVRYLRPRLRH